MHRMWGSEPWHTYPALPSAGVVASASCRTEKKNRNRHILHICSHISLYCSRPRWWVLWNVYTAH